MASLADIPAELDLALAAAEDQPAPQTIADVKVLYALIAQLRAGGKISCRALDAAGKLDPILAALARETALIARLAKVPAHKAALLDLTDTINI